MSNKPLLGHLRHRRDLYNNAIYMARTGDTFESTRCASFKTMGATWKTNTRKMVALI